MTKSILPLNLSQLHVLPLEQRESLTTVDQILKSPDAQPPEVSPELFAQIHGCASAIVEARKRNSSVMLIYGAHLLRNGAVRLLERMMAKDWLTHLATNGAGSIHDWEYAWFGASTESVRMNVAKGQFGTWDETAKNIHLAIMAGALDGLGYGQSMGRLIAEDGVTLPTPEVLLELIQSEPQHPLTAARADLYQAMKKQNWLGGAMPIEHRWKHASIVTQAWKHRVPLTVHPGIGYDIIANHPIFSGSAIGRAGELDFKLFGGSVEQLDGGVVLSIGSAIMGPQVFEKTLSCVNNIRLNAGREVVKELNLYVVDLADGGGWDWSQGEPTKDNAAYYLRFCKSYARMGGTMHYLQCDNIAFVHNLLRQLEAS